LIIKWVVVDPEDMEIHSVVPGDIKATNRLCHEKIRKKNVFCKN
jgi:hypothetical protein